MDKSTHILNSLTKLADFTEITPNEEMISEAKQLPDFLVWGIKTRLAEIGFCLRSDIGLFGVPEIEGMRVRYQDGAIYLDRRCLHMALLKSDALLYDIPFTTIFLPICRRLSDTKAGHLSAHALTLRSLFAESLYPSGRLYGKRDRETLTQFANLNPQDLLREIVKADPIWGDEETVADAYDTIKRYQESLDELHLLSEIPVARFGVRSIGNILDGKPLRWLMDRFGWTEDSGTLLPLQVLAVGEGMANTYLDRSGLITAPTSSGKTFVAELRMLARWSRRDHPRRKTVMLIPTREIGVERWEEMALAYGYDASATAKDKLRVAYSDGEHGQDDYHISNGDFDLCIMVYEKFRYFQQSDDFLKGVGEVVIDELEMLAKDGRGQALELVISGLLSTAEDIVITLLSRPFTNKDEILAFLQDGRKDKPWHLGVTRRPLPIQIGIWEPHAKIATYTDCNDYSKTEEPIDLPYPGNIIESLKTLIKHFLTQTETEKRKGLRNNLVIASPTKRDNLLIAEFIKTIYNDDEDVRAVIDANRNTQFAENRLISLEPSQRRDILSRLLPVGVGVHDADLSPAERELVSRAFRSREIPILLSSQTMAYGINLPAQTIIFLGWGTRPPSGGRPTDSQQYDQYVVGLQDDFVTWLGRVGRYGQRNHRIARALYLSGSATGSDEHSRIMRRVTTPESRIEPQLSQNLTDPEIALYALRVLSREVDGGVTFDELAKFYDSIFGVSKNADAYALVGLMGAGNFHFSEDFQRFNSLVKANQWPDQYELEALIDRLTTQIPKWREKLTTALLKATIGAIDKDGASLTTLRRYSDFAPFRALFIESSGDDNSAVRVDRIAEGLIFENTRIGNIALGFGVEIETVKILAQWLERWADGKSAWSLFDLLAVIRSTPDGEKIPNLRVHRTHYDSVRKLYDERVRQISEGLGVDWIDRTILSNLPDIITLKATFLAMEYWCQGRRMFNPNMGDHPDIEITLGLEAHGSNVRDRARDYNRLLHVMEALIQAMPKREGNDLEENSDRGIVLPHGIGDLVDSMGAGMPAEAADLGRTNIDGLTRGWALDLYDRMQAEGYEVDLPPIERLRLFSQEPEFIEYLPTPGLAQRIRRELETKPRTPVAEALRHEPTKIKSFYLNEAVRRAQVLQGQERYTALRVCHRSAYTVIRRNESKRKPIIIREGGHYDRWREAGAVEFLAEVGLVKNGEYYVDRFLVDLDPRNDFSLQELKILTIEIGNRFKNHNFIEEVYYHWTGGRGFHIVGEFKSGILQSAEQSKRILEGMVDRLSDDIAIFSEDQPYLDEPFVVVDLKPMMKRGVYRNGLSLHANVGGVAVPMTAETLESFNPQKHADMEWILEMLQGPQIESLLACETYSSFVQNFSGLLTNRM